MRRPDGGWGTTMVFRLPQTSFRLFVIPAPERFRDFYLSLVVVTRHSIKRGLHLGSSYSFAVTNCGKFIICRPWTEKRGIAGALDNKWQVRYSKVEDPLSTKNSRSPQPCLFGQERKAASNISNNCPPYIYNPMVSHGRQS
jgi:hypothetical protein